MWDADKNDLSLEPGPHSLSIWFRATLDSLDLQGGILYSSISTFEGLGSSFPRQGMKHVVHRVPNPVPGRDQVAGTCLETLRSSAGTPMTRTGLWVVYVVVT